MAAWARGFALGWSVLVAAVLLWLPVYGSDVSVRQVGAGAASPPVIESRGDLIGVAGGAGVVFLFFPIAMTALPLLAPRSWRPRLTLASAILITLYALLGLASLGMLHIPTATALWFAVAGDQRNATAPPN